MDQTQLRTFAPLIGLVVAAPFLFWRLRRLSQARPLRLELLWVTPTILTALTVLPLIPRPPEGIAWAYLGAALIVGGALGWWRGKMMHISVDPETHALSAKGSPAAILFILVLFGAKILVRYATGEPASDVHSGVDLVTSLFMVFGIGLFGVQRLEMALRATRLLKQTRAAKAV